MGGSVGDETGMTQPHGIPSSGDDEATQADPNQQRQATDEKASRRDTARKTE